MPKDDLVKEIDLRNKRTAAGVRTIISRRSVGGGSTTSQEAVYRPDNDIGYIGRSSVLVVDITSVSSDVIYFNDGIFNGEDVNGVDNGDRVILNQYQKTDEVITILEYIGEGTKGHHGYRVRRGDYSTTPETFDAYKCRGYYSQRIIFSDKSIRQPAFYMRRDWHLDEETMWGYMTRVADSIKSKFYNWIDWDKYGIVAPVGRFWDEVTTTDLEVMNDANIRNTLSAIDYPTSAGLIAGATPVGPGMAVPDAQGANWFYVVSIYNTTTGDINNVFKLAYGDTSIIEYESVGRYISFPSGSQHKAVLVSNADDDFQGVLQPANSVYTIESGALISGHHDDPDDNSLKPNAPLHLDGSVINIDSSLGFLTDDSITADERYLVLAPSTATSSGKYFTQILVGPKVDYSTSESDTDTTDYALASGVETTILTHSLANGYAVGQRYFFSAFLSEEGGRDANFQLRLYNGVTLVDEIEVVLNNTGHSIAGMKVISTAATSGNSMTIKVVATGLNGAAMFVRGTVVATTFKVGTES